jgi:CRP-like cAMP-binding protein
MDNIQHNMIDEKYGTLTFFQGLSEADLLFVLPYFSSACYVGGTAIFEQGDKAENLYLVVSGEIIIRYKPDDGPRMTVTRVQQGGVFGWSAAMGNSCYTSGAVCSLNSEVLSIPGETLRMVCRQNPSIGDILLTRLSLVIAERKKKQLGQISTILNDNICKNNPRGD